VTVSDTIEAGRGFGEGADSISGSTARGTVRKGDTDELTFSGLVTRFLHEGPLRVVFNGNEIGPAPLGEQTSGSTPTPPGAGANESAPTPSGEGPDEPGPESSDEGAERASSPAQVVLSFDDSEPSAKTGAKPIMDEYGYPGIMGIVTDRTKQSGNDDNSLTVARLEAMQADGWVVASHSVTRPEAFTELSEEEIREECHQSREFIVENGLLPPDPAIIYPHGSVDEDVAEIAEEYYTYGLGGEDDPTDGIDDPLRIERAAGHEPGEAREQIDRAIENGGVSVLMFHRIGTFDDPNELDTSEEDFAELMSYIDEQGSALEVITPSQL
jgi:hypothetical protein